MDALVSTSADLLERTAATLGERSRGRALDAAQLTGSAIGVASLGDAFAAAVGRSAPPTRPCSSACSSGRRARRPPRAAFQQRPARRQAREVIELSVSSQQRSWPACSAAGAARSPRHGAGIDRGGQRHRRRWAAFGDLMAVMLGVFVLILLGVVGAHLHTAAKLEHVEREQARLAAQRQTLERALAAPLAAGRVTGRIGIRGSLLFSVSPMRCRTRTRPLRELAAPLSGYLSAGDLMAAATTARCWGAALRRQRDLSAQLNSLSRALVEEGVPAVRRSPRLGDQQPVVPTTTKPVAPTTGGWRVPVRARASRLQMAIMRRSCRSAIHMGGGARGCSASMRWRRGWRAGCRPGTCGAGGAAAPPARRQPDAGPARPTHAVPRTAWRPWPVYSRSCAARHA